MNGGMPLLDGLERMTRGAAGAVDSPDDIAGLVAWYKTESLVGPSNGVAITSWPDASANARTATPNGTGFIYRTNVVNSRAVVEVSSDYAPFTSANLGTSHTVFVVFRPIVGFADGVIIGGDASGKYMPYIDATDMYYRALSSEAFVTVAHGGLSGGTAYLFSIVRSGLSVSFYKNASQLSTTQTLAANTALTIVQLSGLAGATFTLNNAQLAEVVVYDSALSTSDRQAIETYLNDRFAMY